MQFNTLALSLFVAVVAADSVSDLRAQLPSCSVDCLNNASTAVGCGVDDTSCQCGKVDDLTSESIACLSTSCSDDDLTTTAQLTGEICVAALADAGSDTASSAIASASNAVSSAVASASGAVSSAVDGVTNTAATASPTPTTGAGNQASAGMGLVGAAALAAMVL
ncbi:hypothetical protein F4778DRAFT_610179 [Xylariomycetidae sp. FL2044]|nr:hypothetical protein F4778DRAFT_610179 [Xylariomycetidae sp. FL2044]